MLLARSRHASVRSLERYARPGPEAVARHVAEQDPARRRRSMLVAFTDCPDVASGWPVAANTEREIPAQCWSGFDPTRIADYPESAARRSCSYQEGDGPALHVGETELPRRGQGLVE